MGWVVGGHLGLIQSREPGSGEVDGPTTGRKGLRGVHGFRPCDGDCIGGGDRSGADGGVHVSRLYNSGCILATCVSGGFKTGGLLGRDGMFVCFNRLSGMTCLLPVSWVGVDGLRGGLFSGGRVSIDVSLSARGILG